MNAPVATPLTGEIIHEDGIYFGLDDETYFADRALGSTDLKLLLGDVSAFWWERSGLEVEKDSPSRQIGRAVHRFVLEGPDRFAACYGRAALNGSTKEGRAESEAIAAAGKVRLKAEDYDRIVAAGTLIRSNPHVASAFTGGMPEVSVFWTEDVDGEPVRRKARFDYLKVRAIVDLKSCAPFADATFGATWRRAMRFWRYHVQAAAYIQARWQIPRLVAEGRVFGEVDREWLDRVVATSARPEDGAAPADTFAFAFVFWASSGPPLTGGGYLSPGNPLFEQGAADVARALSRYVECRREFGDERAWIRPEPFAELDPIEVQEWWRANDAA